MRQRRLHPTVRSWSLRTLVHTVCRSTNLALPKSSRHGRGSETCRHLSMPTVTGVEFGNVKAARYCDGEVAGWGV